MNSTDTLFNATGYFGPDSETWKIYREPTFLFGSIRALLLQIAHPAVAEGVARFSNFEKDAFGRGKRTFIAMTWLYFGDRQQADQAARKMNALHRPIKGEYPVPNAEYGMRNAESLPNTEFGMRNAEYPAAASGRNAEPASGRLTTKPYFANDPALKTWVLATLVDTTLLMYETIYRPLDAATKAVFYEESKRAALLLGIPLEVYPADYEAFRRYFDTMLEKGNLEIGESGRKVCHAILNHKYAPGRISRVLATGFMPGHLVDSFGLKRKKGDDLFFKRMLGVARFFFRWTPGFLRWVPAWHQAMHRVAKASKQPSSWLGRCYDRMGKFFDLPFGIPSGDMK